MQELLNLFSLHGKYFRDDENRFTASFLFLLSESRNVLLPALLRNLAIDLSGVNFTPADIVFQSRLPSGTDIPDAEIRLGDHFKILIEAKIGQNGLGLDQIRRYASYLAGTEARQKRLLCVTQFNDQENFNSIRGRLDSLPIPSDSYAYRQWYELLDLIKKELNIREPLIRTSERRIRQGKSVDHVQRMAALFLEEVEQSMYDKKSVDELRACELEDIKVTSQSAWFMRVAKNTTCGFRAIRQNSACLLLAT